MRNPLGKIFGAKSGKPAKDPTVFATTLVPERNRLSGNDHYKAMVARERVDGLFEVAVESFFEARATNSMIAVPHRPGGDEPVVVDGNAAYEMLMEFEGEHYSPGDGLTKTLEGVGHASEMRGHAARARVKQAEESGGVAMKLATSRKRRRQRGKNL